MRADQSVNTAVSSMNTSACTRPTSNSRKIERQRDDQPSHAPDSSWLPARFHRQNVSEQTEAQRHRTGREMERVSKTPTNKKIATMNHFAMKPYHPRPAPKICFQSRSAHWPATPRRPTGRKTTTPWHWSCSSPHCHRDRLRLKLMRTVRTSDIPTNRADAGNQPEPVREQNEKKIEPKNQNVF